MAVQAITPNDKVVVVMGPTGSGKSTFVDYATDGLAGGIGHSLQACTGSIRLFKTDLVAEDGRPVLLVDTPGLDDADKPEVHVVNMVAKALLKASTSRKFRVDTILYTQRITDNRLTGMALHTLGLFANLLGNIGTVPDVTVVTTMWKNERQDVGKMREDCLRNDFKVQGRECKIERFGDSRASALGIVKNSIEDASASLPVQSRKGRRASAPATPVENSESGGVEGKVLLDHLKKLIKEQKEVDRRSKVHLWSQFELLFRQSKSTKKMAKALY
ncbi:hypothetical protein FRB91_008600 [Serendipita sp. 411]|nr:hypothetical protein FRC18_011278 [Serendipita sp. 400]KAG8859233.1 hypothetical protein FRB91_008600 [Serendipita sp. 411]